MGEGRIDVGVPPLDRYKVITCWDRRQRIPPLDQRSEGRKSGLERRNESRSNDGDGANGTKMGDLWNGVKIELSTRN